MFFGCKTLKKISIGATATADGTKLSDCTGGMLTGAGTNAEGGTQLILPQSVASGEAGFSVEDLLSASGSGENIKPYYANENGEIQDAILTVKVTGVTINLNSIIFNIDASITLTATVTPENAADKSVTWSSSNESVATVEQNGKISAVGVGEATITVTTTDGGKTATCKVIVNKKAGAISYATASVNKTFGDANFTNELTKTGDGTVTYSSSDTKVAEVDSKTGEVTIMGKGEATITATVEDGDNYTYATKTASYKINVTAVKVPDPTINPSDNYENDGDPLASK
jgi:uncharacterized protein YjdB